MAVAELLMSQHRWGHTRARRFLAGVPMTETKTIGSMTERQRRNLAAMLEAQAPRNPRRGHGTRRIARLRQLRRGRRGGAPQHSDRSAGGPLPTAATAERRPYARANRPPPALSTRTRTARAAEGISCAAAALLATGRLRDKPVSRASTHDLLRRTTMARTRIHNVSAAQWSANGESLGAQDLTQPGNELFGANVFSAAEQRKRLPKHVYSQLRAHDRARRRARHLAGRRRRAGDEGVGARERRHPLHPLVPADDRPDGREARLLLQPDRRRHRDRRVLRQGADPGRAGRLELPVRRHPRDLRGPRLHRLGPDLPRVPPGEPQRRAALHPDRVRLLDRRGARQQDPAAALDGRALGRRRARAAPARRRRGPARLHDRRPGAGVLPDRRAVLLRAPRPGHDRPHAVRRQAAQGPGARRPLLRLDPRARSWPACSTPRTSSPSSACRSRPATTRSRRTSTRSRRSSRAPTSAATTRC